MNTFLPYASFSTSCQSLDPVRANKQAVEAVQMLQAVLFGGPWSNHCAVRMWKGYESQLGEYALDAFHAARMAGYEVKEYRVLQLSGLQTYTLGLHMKYDEDPNKPPPWLGDDQLHTRYRHMLYRKDTFYGKYGWLADNSCGDSIYDDYVWYVPALPSSKKPHTFRGYLPDQIERLEARQRK